MTYSAVLTRTAFTWLDSLMQSLLKSLMPHFSLSDRDGWKEETNQKRFYSWVSERGEMLKKRAIASVRTAARLQAMSPQVNNPVHFFTNKAESNNNRLKAKKGRHSSGFIGTIEAVESNTEEEEEEFAQAVGGVSQSYELHPLFAKFTVPDFMDWMKIERTSYLEKLRKATMEELYAAENPTSLSLVPDSVIRRQNVASLTSDPGKSDLAHSYFNDSDFEESDLSEQTDPEESLISGLSNLENDERLQHLYNRTREAKLLLHLNSVWQGPRAPDGSRSFSIASQSGKRPNYTLMDDGGKVKCECPHWKATNICCYALAVAEKEDEIASYLTWYGKLKSAKKRNFTSAANLNVKKSTLGDKGRRPKRLRSGKPPSATLSENTKSSTTCKYKLKWLKDTKAFKCYGCNSAIRVPDEIPDPPNDLIASTNEYRSFMKDGKLQVHFGPTHYHLRAACIATTNPEFDASKDMLITENDKRSFKEPHKRLIYEEFQL